MKLYRAGICREAAEKFNEGNREHTFIFANEPDEVFEMYLDHLADSYLYEDGTCPLLNDLIGWEEAIEVDELGTTERKDVPHFMWFQGFTPYTLPCLATEAVIARVHHEHKEEEAKRNAEIEEHKRLNDEFNMWLKEHNDAE